MKLKIQNQGEGELNNRIHKDYENSLLTIIWATYNDSNHLVFAMMEFYPNEIEEISEISIDSIRLEKNDNVDVDIEIYFCRRKMTSQEALTTYREYIERKQICLIDENDNIFIDGASKHIQIPFWPKMTVGKRDPEFVLPFLSESSGCCRMHHILPEELDTILLSLVEYEKPIHWMRERLPWDISVYPELLGSMHLVLPNPLIRNVEERMIPGNPNRVSIFLELREGKSMDDLSDMKFLSVERGVFGMCNMKETFLSNYTEPRFILDFSDCDTEQFSFALYDKHRGLLEWSSFGYFIKAFDIDMRVANAMREIHTPNGTPYEVTVYEPVSKVNLNNEEKNDWGERLFFSQVKRKQGRLAKKLGQKLFEPNHPEDAKIFIRELIQKASRRVIIIDPFFTTKELFDFVLAIQSPVDVTIITSKDVMNRRSELKGGSSTETIGDEIYTQTLSLKDKLIGYKIEIKVMTGDKPLIHDRFLIIDDEVWFSGNSLNDIGNRLSMLIRLPNPGEILDVLKELESKPERRIETMEEWKNKRER